VEDWRKADRPPPVRRVLPGPRNLCWLLLRRRSELDDAEHVLLTEMCRRSGELGSARRLAQQFMVLVRERRGTHLEEWITDVQTTCPPELRGFSRNLHRDWMAVQAGPDQPVIGGQVVLNPDLAQQVNCREKPQVGWRIVCKHRLQQRQAVCSHLGHQCVAFRLFAWEAGIVPPAAVSLGPVGCF
jgi:hypothetical protein